MTNMSSTLFNVTACAVIGEDNMTKAEAQLHISLGTPAIMAFKITLTVLAVCGNTIIASVLPRWGGISHLITYLC